MLFLRHDSGSATSIDGFQALSFYRFVDSDPVQQDVVLNTTYWLQDQTRKYFANREFLEASKEFDERILLSGNSTDQNSIEDILLVADAAGLAGPQLTVPSSTLARAAAFTVELWFAFETMASQNLTIVGMSDKKWTKGFGIVGVLNSTGMALACALDTLTSSDTVTSCGFATSVCKSFSTSVRVWHHVSCSRSGNSTARLTFDSVSLQKSVTFGTSVGGLFANGNLVMGARETDATKTAGFSGYIREMRMWNRWLSDQELVSRKHLYVLSPYRRRRRLAPMDYSSLVGYWPLTGGRGGDMFEVSGHSQQSISLDSANTASVDVFGVGSFSWVRQPALWTLALCRSEYIYHPASDSCVKRRPFLAPYFGAIPLSITSDSTTTIPDFEISMSVWVYHTSLTTSGIIFEVSNVTSLGFMKDPNLATATLSATYGKTAEAVTVTATPTPPAVRRWVHYGLITVVPADTSIGNLQATFYLNDYSSSTIFNSPTTVPDSVTFNLGSSLLGYIREVKVWSAGIDASDMLYERF